MKHRKLIVILSPMILLMIILCSCNKPDKRKKDDVYYPQYNNDESYNIGKDVSNTDESNDLLLSKDNEVNATASNSSNNNMYDSVYDFSSINYEFNTPDIGNLGINLKLNSKVLFCSSKDNKKIYYINYGHDNYIYELQGKQSTLLLDSKALSIQLWNNELYFIMEESDKEKPINTGAIYKYNIETKEVSLLVDANTSWMYVCSDGIYFSDINITDKIEFNSYLYSFRNNILESNNYYSLALYKDFIYEIDFNDIDYIDGKRHLVNINNGEEIIIDKYYPNVTGDSIYNNNLYYIGEDERLFRIDLLTGMKHVYSIRDFETSDIGPNGETIFANSMISGYTVFRDKVIISSFNYFFYSDLNDNKLLKFDTNFDMSSAYSDLFVCEDRLFAIKSVNKDKFIVELTIDENNVISDELIGK